MALFNSEDAKERKMLSLIMFQLYKVKKIKQQIIREAIYNTINYCVSNACCHNGIAELLGLLSTIYFSLLDKNLKNEFSVTLEKTLLPLHKLENYISFSSQISYLLSIYIKADPSVTTKVFSI